MSFSQTSRIMRLEVAAGPAGLLANRLNARETISADFEYQLEVLSEDARVDVHSMLGRRANVELVREDGSLRHFNGHIVAMRLVRTDAGFAYYSMTLRPWTAFLSVTRDQYIFHDVSLMDVIDRTFADYPQASYEYRITGAIPQFTDCVQHSETDWNHLCRRMEQAGWHTWFEHAPGGHKLIIADDSTRNPPIDGDVKVPWQSEAGSFEDDGVSAFAVQAQMLPGHRADGDFDFKGARTRRVDVPSIAARGELPPLEVYEYQGAYGFKSTGDGDARIRRDIEAIEAAGLRYEGQGNERSMQPGRWFKLSGHFDESETEFLVTEVQHSIWNNYLQEANAPAQYRNHLVCVPKGIPWRPGRGFNSVETKVYGTQTAIVVGPAGEEIHCDKYGRVRVQFHWDRVGKYDQTSSAWVRVASTWAGSNFGAIAIPRIGQEVVISYLGGDADRPLVTGSVYNEAHMPPWDLPANQTQTGILSRSSKGGGYDNANAIRFEDKKGAEQLWLHAEKDQLTEVEHDEDKWVGNDRRKTIDRDETNHIKRDRTETVDRDETITVHNNRTERVDHNEQISIGDNRTEDVGKNETISIGDNRTERVGKNETISIGHNRSEDVGHNESISIGQNRTVSIGGMKSETVALAKAESIGLAKSLNIGLAYQIGVGAAMSTTVGMMQTEQVMQSKDITVGTTFGTKVGQTYTLDVGSGGGGGGGSGGPAGETLVATKDSGGGQSGGGGGSNITMDAETITLKVGKSTLTLKADGTMTLNGHTFSLGTTGEQTFKADENITLKGKKILEN